MQAQGTHGQSSLLKAGTILLLVGWIMATAAACFLVPLGLFLGYVVATFIAYLYAGIGLLLAVGAVLGHQAWRRAQRGELDGAFRLGLAMALLPPVQVVPLLGAIFVKVCPEASAAAPPAPPLQPAR